MSTPKELADAVASGIETVAWRVLLVVFVLAAVPPFLSKIWHSKVRYQVEYSLDGQHVFVSDKPHDCDFFEAPMGDKSCHYDVNVSTLRWARSQEGSNAIMSYDEGKTWSTFTPDAHTFVPTDPTVEDVYVTWEKKDE